MDIKQSLKQLKTHKEAGAPSQDFVEKNREILLMQITNSAGETKRYFAPVYAWRAFDSVLPETLSRFVVKPVLLGVLMFGIIFGGWTATVSASENSLPGDTLYPIKLFVEKTQLTFAPKEDEVSLRVEFAERRLEEMRQILEEPYSEEQEENTLEAVSNFNEQVKAVQTTIEDLDSEGETEASVEAANIINTKTEEYNIVLEKVKESLEEGETKEELQKATDTVDDANIKAVEVIVKNEEDEVGEPASETIINKVEDTIQTVEKKVSKVEEGVVDEDVEALTEEVKVILDEAKDALEDNELGVVMEKVVEAKNLVNNAIVVSSTLVSAVEEEPEEEGSEEPVIE
ncbi:DUF5667 domain-containing protein [Patescibacteria group bacterium]